MAAGAGTPEELETLLEDAFVLRDHQALAQLFEPGALLVADDDRIQARGHQEITRLAAVLWDLERGYLADPHHILQVHDTALVFSNSGISVARRGSDGSWRYAISVLDLQGRQPPRKRTRP